MSLRAIATVLTLSLALVLAGCEANSSLSSVSVTPPSAALTAVGQTAQFAALGNYTRGKHPSTTRDITDQVQWSVSAPSVATVNATGLVTAVGAGTATVTASINGSLGVVAGTANLTVSTNSGGGGSARSLTSLAIIPSNQTVSKLGETAQYIAIGTFSSTPTTQDVTPLVAWQSSDVAIATIDPSGLATAIACNVTNSTPPCVTTITAVYTDPNTFIVTTGTSTFTQATTGGGGNLPSLTVYLVGLGSGTVTSLPPGTGINCTGSGTGCTANFVLGTTVTLSATASPATASTPASVFGGWSANCSPVTATTCTLVMSDNATVGAIFNH
jgi:Bacterial Ig-like domain (group 2)